MFDDLDRGLARIRTFLLEGVRAGETMQNALSANSTSCWPSEAGRTAIEHYPDRALGHLVFPLGAGAGRPFAPSPGFGTAAAEGLLAAGRAALEDERAYPVWNDSPGPDHPAAPGIVGGRAPHRPGRRRGQVRGAARGHRGRRVLARRPSPPRPALGRRRLQHQAPREGVTPTARDAAVQQRRAATGRASRGGDPTRPNEHMAWCFRPVDIRRSSPRLR